MAHQNGPRHLSEWQWQHLLVTTACLRDMNRQAELQLRNIEDSFATGNDYRQAGDMFAILAIQINSNLDFREEVLAPDPRTAPHVVIHFSCRDCHPKLAADADEASPELVLKIDPEHRVEVDELLELGQRVSELALPRYSARKICAKTFFVQLSRLMKAVQRQCRHLRELDSAPPPKVQCVIEPCSCRPSRTAESTGEQNITSR